MSIPKSRMSPLERHPEYTQAIGLVGIEVGVLEVMLGELLGALLGVEKHVGQIIYMTPKSFIGRLEILQNVAASVLVSSSKGLRKINGLVNRAQSRINYRNTVMHSVWGLKADDRVTVTRRTVPFLEGKNQIDVPLSELKSEVRATRELTNDIIAETDYITAERARFFASLRKRQKQTRPAGTAKVPRGGRSNTAPQ